MDFGNPVFRVIRALEGSLLHCKRRKVGQDRPDWKYESEVSNPREWEEKCGSRWIPLGLPKPNLLKWNWVESILNETQPNYFVSSTKHCV